uniref:Uncharacterized protein n=1 Tax=Aegilops tauschii subsp. strangulata TaxID=200361 RepID=A0A453JH25_AEGTS
MPSSKKEKEKKINLLQILHKKFTKSSTGMQPLHQSYNRPVVLLRGRGLLGLSKLLFPSCATLNCTETGDHLSGSCPFATLCWDAFLP